MEFTIENSWVIDAAIERHGYAVVPGILSPKEIQNCLKNLGRIRGPGQRNVLDIPKIAVLARSPRLLALAAPNISSSPRAVCAIYFSKSPQSNWAVGWHQDLTIAVRERIDIPGFGPWSIKENVVHTQPPAEVLADMITVRLHLDDCGESDGALRILPGSHKRGRLSPARIEELRAEISEKTCTLRAGDALLMRPLLLHASGKSRGTGERRVLHIEYAGADLPGGLRWVIEGQQRKSAVSGDCAKQKAELNTSLQ